MSCRITRQVNIMAPDSTLMHPLKVQGLSFLTFVTHAGL